METLANVSVEELDSAVDAAIERAIALDVLCFIDVFQYTRSDRLDITITAITDNDFDKCFDMRITCEYATERSVQYWTDTVMGRLLNAGLLVSISSFVRENNFGKPSIFVGGAYFYFQGDEHDLLIAALKYGGEILNG